MPTDEDTLRRIIREELAAALASMPPARINGHPVSPELSAKRRQAARARWGESISGTRPEWLTRARSKGGHTQREWLALVRICGGTCLKCHRTGGIVKDHIIPIHLGGSDSIENLQPLCRGCNTSKGRTQTDYRAVGWKLALQDALQEPLQPLQKPPPPQQVINQGTAATYSDAVGNFALHPSDAAVQKPQRKAKKLSTALSTAESKDKAPAQTSGTRAFLGYAEAYVKRYGEFPIRNARNNALLKRLVALLGDAEAGPVAGYYCGLDDRLYAGSGHCLSLLVRDAEKLRTLWKQGAVTANGGGGGGGQARPWWEVWSALEAQGRDLGIEEGDNPTTFKNAVLRAAFVAGRLPPEIAARMGVDTDPGEGA